MFGIASLTTKRLLTYGAVAFVSQHLFRRSRRNAKLTRQSSNKIDTASQDSFPASDPPAWTGGIVGPSSDQGRI